MAWSRVSTRRFAVLTAALITLACVALFGVKTSVPRDRLTYFQRVKAFVSTEASDRAAVSTSALSKRLISTGNTQRGTDAARADSIDGETDELMTPELIEQIEREQINPLAPVQVRMVWIGDISKAPKEHTQYRERGFNLTVHTSAEEILAGFQPFVLRAYRLALPKVVGYDFLKFALLYKYGGLAVDADTSPVIDASELQFPSDCDIVFGKEASVSPSLWEKPVFRESGGADYGLNRPFQILNWAMAAAAPRNKHVKWLLQTAMMHFFGLRDMETSLIQDISGSGLMTDYVALLHEKHGRHYRDVFIDNTKYIPVEGLCLTIGHFHNVWTRHSFLSSWKKHEARLPWQYLCALVVVAALAAFGYVVTKRLANNTVRLVVVPTGLRYKRAREAAAASKSEVMGDTVSDGSKEEQDLL